MVAGAFSMPHATDPTRAAKALIAWWREAGVDAPEIAPAPANAPPGSQPAPKQSPQRPSFTERVRGGDRPSPAAKPAPPPQLPASSPFEDTLSAARRAADAARSLDALKAALETFESHPLHAAATTTVFARGARDASVMVVGEAPGREEDAQGSPFVGRSGQLMDAMFAAIGLSAEENLYITNILNWRPPGNRNPSAEEIALCAPFIERHIALKAPKILVLAGGVSAKALLKTDQGIMRLRGRWASYRPASASADEIPALAIYHPAFLLRRPIAKREAWADLLNLEARLKTSA